MKQQILLLLNAYSSFVQLPKALKATLLAALFFGTSFTASALTITMPTGGAAVCKSRAGDGASPQFTALGNIVIGEVGLGDFGGGPGALIYEDSMTLEMPMGWTFNTGVTPTITYTAGQNITSAFITNFTATSFMVHIKVNRSNKLDAITISNLQVQATSMTTPDDFITASMVGGIAGVTTGSGGTSFAALGQSDAPGVIDGSLYLCPSSTTSLSNSIAGGTWLSSDPAVASIGSSSGVATGNTIGTSSITYTLSNGCYSTATVDVAALGSISGTNNACLGQTIWLSNALTGGTWTSSNPSVATVDVVSGGVTGVTIGGTATITYTRGCLVFHTVTVFPTPAAITGLPYACQGSANTLSIASTGGAWESTAPGVVEIDPITGIDSGRAPGSAEVRYVYPTGCYSSYYITTNQPPLPIEGPNQICESSSAFLYGPYGGTWSSSNIAIATIDDPSGYTTGITGGNVTISYSVLGCPPAEYSVTINPLPGPITGLISACIGVAGVLSSTSPGGDWLSSDVSVAEISSTGVLTAVSFIPGATATIYYILPTGCLVSTMVTINLPPAEIVGADSVCQGGSTTLSNVTPGGIWSSTDLARAAIVDSTGVLLGVSAGTANISYTLANGCYSVLPFRIKPLIPAYVNISTFPDTVLCEGTSVLFTATPTDAGEPTYEWYRFGSLVGIGDSFTYVPSHGDVITVWLTVGDVCAVADTVMDTASMNVYPIMPPSVVINKASSPSTITYLGQEITFYSDVTYGGPGTLYQWYKDGAAIPGATRSTLTVAIYGTETYYCKIISDAPCTTTPNATSNSITIIGDYLGASDMSVAISSFSLFPNPNNGSFTLTGKAGSDISYQVNDMLGRVVVTGVAIPQNGMIYEQVKLDASLAAGSYLLHVHSAAGSQVFRFAISK